MTMGKEGSYSVVHECQHKCSSKAHASNLTAALTKDYLSDEKVAAYLKWCCVRYPKAVDSEGRTLLHMAASKGRLKLLTFLVKHRDININEKDKESHFTALHRSLFYGQIHCAVRLIQLGANIEQLDLDELTPLDHVLKDRPFEHGLNKKKPDEVYVWGTNTNYTLGIGRHQSRANPEPLDMFSRQGISIKQVVMSKFHSAFISSDGRLWTCGHGQGGRLGREGELATLTPKPVKVASNSECRFVALGADHTILLMADNSVWSFGLNTYHQLGHEPPPDKVLTPKVIKALKNVNIIGISASKYHSVFWSTDQLYTCGLNGGQLGHVKGPETTIPVPKAVTIFNVKKCTIKFVTSSDGATVLTSSNGVIYLFHEYQCKKITLRPFSPKIVRAVGGNLDHKLNVGCLQEKGGDELKILIITSLNSVCLWQESTGKYLECDLSFRCRQIKITDVALNKNFFLITSSDGTAFQAEIKNNRKKSGSEKLPCKLTKDYVKLTRIPHIHRAVGVTSDLKGRNFAVIQFHPKACWLTYPKPAQPEMENSMKNLFDMLEYCDYFQDVKFEVQGRQFLAHHYIVAHSSRVLEEMIKKGVRSNGVSVVKIENISAQIFNRILCYIYTQGCDLLHLPLQSSEDSDLKEGETVPDTTDSDGIDEEVISAFAYHNRKHAPKKKPAWVKEKEELINLLMVAAKRFELLGLKKGLEELLCGNGIEFRSKKTYSSNVPLRFGRENFQHLWDVTLKSEDEFEIKAHKCILVSRLEYFNCMINKGWREATQRTAITLPVPGKILQILIDYLYTDEASELMTSEDPDLAFMTLVVADQFFCDGLRQFAECSLANLMSLRNAAETLQIAVTCNADQLKRCAMEFICLNMTALLESRSLEILADSVLKELSEFYRKLVPMMCVRHITAYDNAPDEKLVEMISRTEPVSLESVEEDSPTKLGSKSTKKKAREKRNSESGRIRNTSTGSFTSEDEPEPLVILESHGDSVKEEEDEEAWVKIVNHPAKQQKNSQAKIRTPVEASKMISKTVQEDRFVNLNTIPVKEQQKVEIVQPLEKEFQLLFTTSEKEFPALNASPSERNFSSHPQTPRQNQKVFEKFVKLSQKQRKKLAAQSTGENEDILKKTEITIKSPWGVTKNEPQLLVDIMKEESKAGTSQNSSLASSPPWQNTAKLGLSLSAVIASERRERELITRMKSKPLMYIQMEDKAMEDLLLLYNADDVTDERITVRRAEYEFLSPPIWVSSRK